MRWKYIIYVCAIVLLFSCGAYYSYIEPNVSLTEMQVQIEVNSEFDPYHYVLKYGSALLDEEKEEVRIEGIVNTAVPGTYTLLYNGHMKLIVEVEDTVKPYMSADDITLSKDAEFIWDKDTLQHIQIQDNFSSEEYLRSHLSCDSIDTAKLQDQRVVCRTKDESGNKAELTITAHIKEDSKLQSLPQSVSGKNSITSQSTIRLSIPEVSFTSVQQKEILEIFYTLNKERSQAGLTLLSLENGDLQAIVYVRTKEVQQLYSHIRPNGRDCFTVLSDYGYTYQSAGENIAKGQRTSQEVMRDWMNSSSHRSNILNPEFHKVAIGVLGKGDQKVWVQIFLQ